MNHYSFTKFTLKNTTEHRQSKNRAVEVEKPIFSKTKLENHQKPYFLSKIPYFIILIYPFVLYSVNYLK